MASPTDLTFRLLYACLGLHTGFPRKRFLQKATFIAWFFIHVSGCLITVMFWRNKLLDAETRSMATISMFGNDCVFIAALIFFNVRIVFNHDEVELFVRRNGRRVRQLISQATFWAPSGLICLRRGLYGTEKGVGQKEVYFSLLHLLLMVFFSLSVDLASNLKDAHEEILTLAANIEAYRERIRSLKWELRDRIRRINELFSWLWAVHCLLTFETAVFIVVEMSSGQLSMLDKIVHSMAEIFPLVRFSLLADGSSSLKNLCLEMEVRFLRRDSKNGIRKNTAESLLPVMAYREDWDILRSGSFPLETGRFLGFLATSLTCTAVVLQFDHHILRTISQMTRQPT